MVMIEPDFGRSASVVLHPVEKKEMLSLTSVGGQVHVRINSSSLALLQECPRKAFYSLKEGWKPASESPALLFGRAIHKALEVFYRGKPEDRVLPAFADVEMMGYGHAPATEGLVVDALRAFLETSAPLASLPEGDKRSQQNGIWTLHEYFKKFIDDPYVAYVDDRGPFIERTFTYRLIEESGLIVDIFGTIDFAFRHITTGDILIGDHKTSSSLGWGESSYFDRDKPNHQYTMYMLGANRVFGLKTDSFVVNVVEVKAKPKTARGSGPSFPRQVTKRTEEDYVELTETIRHYVKQYVEFEKTAHWPMGGVDACNKYGGCSFKVVCASPQAMRKTLLQNKFIQETT